MLCTPISTTSSTATVNLLCAAFALKDARDLRALSTLTVAEVNTLERHKPA